MPPVPIAPYAVSKLAGEGHCRSFWQVYGLETVALRYFNVFGPRQDPALPVRGSDPDVRHRFSRWPAPDHPRGRRAVPRLHLHRERGRGNSPGRQADGVAGETFNVASGSGSP